MLQLSIVSHFPFLLFNKTLLHSLSVCAILVLQHSAVFFFHCGSYIVNTFVTILLIFFIPAFRHSYHSHLSIIHITKEANL